MIMPRRFQYKLHKTHQISNIQCRLFLSIWANQLNYPVEASPLPETIKHVDHEHEAVKLMAELGHQIRVVFEWVFGDFKIPIYLFRVDFALRPVHCVSQGALWPVVRVDVLITIVQLLIICIPRMHFLPHPRIRLHHWASNLYRR